MSNKPNLSIIGVRHPYYLRDQLQWDLWRDTFEGGRYYLDHYLQKFSERETDAEFATRKTLTPIPTFAKAAILDVRNSIYQRLVEVTRVGGSPAYQNAIRGERGGVNGEGASMDSFIGKDILTELLIMGKVGCYVDVAPAEGETLADVSYPPYLTYYRVEDILSYDRMPRGKGGEFRAVMLRDWNVSVKSVVSGVELPSKSETQYRLVWKDDDGVVYYKLFNEAGEIILTEDSLDDGRVRTGLTRVPFVMFDIGDSLLKDVSSYQRALLNLTSSDVYYAIKSNSPFLTIQRDSYGSGDHLKQPETANGTEHVEEAGGGKGRYYGPSEERPQFIAPPTDPLEASMKLQDRMQDSIRELINLAVTNKTGSRTESAEAKKIGSQGLENGLAFIGMVLEQGEKLIAAIWAEYEDTKNPKPATIHYPDRYILKDDMERLEEADKLVALAQKLPGKELKRTVTNQIVLTLLGGKLPKEQVDKILNEVKRGDYLIGDSQDIFQAHKEGLVSTVTASDQLGYNGEKEVDQAKKDRAERIALTLAAQTPRTEGDEDPSGPPTAGPAVVAARGAPELGTNPNAGTEEKEDKPGRGPGVDNDGDED